mgnify:CR=1 FL=1
MIVKVLSLIISESVCKFRCSLSAEMFGTKTGSPNSKIIKPSCPTLLILIGSRFLCLKSAVGSAINGSLTSFMKLNTALSNTKVSYDDSLVILKEI